MLVFNYSPSPQEYDLGEIYAQSAREGMVHSALMRGEHFDMASAFTEDWATDAVCWSWGGRETYLIDGRKALAIEPAGVLTIAAGERYAYDASAEAPFRSNMITFPQWMSRDAAVRDEFFGAGHTHLRTRLCRPSGPVLALMNAIATRCSAGANNDAWYAEQTALLFAQLLDEQHADGAGAITATKPATRAELARRIERSVQLILECYGNAALSLDDMARTACISRFHFVRIFKEAKGATPMQFLTGVRMDAARRLLRHSKATVGDVAAAIGYADRAAFVRSFKRRFGCAPSAMRSNDICFLRAAG